VANEECAGQAQACLIRVAKLAADGSPLDGESNLYVSAGLISLEWSPDIATGDELEQVDGCGNEIVYFRAPDRVRKLDLTLTLGAPEPELLALLEGGVLHALSAVTTGYGHPGTGTIGEGVNDVSIELWQNIIVDGSIAARARYAWPRTRGWRRTGGTHQNDILDVALEGFSVNAGLWGGGPAGDWGDLSDEDPNLMDWALEANALPEPSCGAQALLVPT
jgi:hypothetical protein